MIDAIATGFGVGLTLGAVFLGMFVPFLAIYLIIGALIHYFTED